MNNTQQIALVTGANRGIGLEICRQLLNAGIKVVLSSRSEDKGQEACKLLESEGLKASYHVLDVSNEDSISNCIDYLDQNFGRCDILVNNAGIFPETADASSGFVSVFESKVETITSAFQTNTLGPLMLSQTIVPLMKKNDYGRIVNISSGMGQLSDMNGGFPAYRMSKTALNTLTRILADELSGDNILVNSMCPGWVRTDMGGPDAERELPEGADTALWLATLEDRGPSGAFFRDRKQIPW